MYELIGGHINHVQGGVPETIGQWLGAVNVLLHPFPEMSWLHGQTQGRTVVRAFPDDSQNPDFNNPNMQPIAAARVMVGRVMMSIGQYPASHVQITNEPDVTSSRDAMKRLSDFDAECSRLMAQHGRRITLANLGTGNPPNMAWWADYLPAIQQGMADGAVLLVHAYTWPGVDDRWYLWRHRMIYEGCPEHGWAGLPRRLWIDLVLGEIGFDKGTKYQGVYGGWRDLMDPQAYATWLNQTGLNLLTDEYCVGAAVFACSVLDKGKWYGYDIWPEPAHQIAATATPVYRHKTEPKIMDLVRELPVMGKYPIRWKKRVNQVILHHTGGRAVVKDSVSYIKAINRWCQRTKGWPGIPYMWMVGQDGTKYRCLKPTWMGYHCGGHNRLTEGIASIGNHTIKPPTAPQQRSVQELIRWRGHPCKEHREYHITACPGFEFC